MTIPVNHMYTGCYLTILDGTFSPMEGSINHPWGFGEIDSHMLSGMLPGKQTFADDDYVSD